MLKKEVIEFFNRCAPTWDANMVKNDRIIGIILDNAEVTEGLDILDVACGTGVMVPYYLERNVASVTGIDISPEMAKIAAEKFEEVSNFQIICGDVEEVQFERKFDRIVVYNALPHFPKPKHLIKVLTGLLKDGGRLTIAHGAGREVNDDHHKNAACKVSDSLMSAENLKKLFERNYDVEITIDSSRMYQVSGIKRNPDIHFIEGIPHTHGGIVHSHSHGDEEHDHIPDKDSTPMEELLVLMKYLVSHNDAHAQEVADLAQELRIAGEYVAYDEIMDAVADFDMVNAKLDAVLNKLTGERIWGSNW
jgi:demethylmenaquinone methyltransferase/2-methoxy-6-polyprenyl-1,4-benzoquinol methylase